MMRAFRVPGQLRQQRPATLASLHAKRRVRTARGCVARGRVRTVIGVEDRRRADTCGGAWRPPLRERGLTIFRRYFPVQTAADGLAAGGMHASRVCRGRVFGTTARLVCRPQAHLVTSAPRGLCKRNPENAATFAAPTVVWRDEGLSLRRRLGRLQSAYDHPGWARRRGVSGQRLRDLIVVGHAHP
jgi:hypothetical protein